MRILAVLYIGQFLCYNYLKIGGRTMNETNYFEAGSEQKYICFAPCERDLWGNNHCDNTENNINIIELSYRQEDEGGWGVGGGVYITTQDIAAVSKGVQQIIKRELEQFSYDYLGELIKINVTVNENGLITFKVSMLETLCGEYYIIVELNNLTFKEFSERTNVFIEWERKFPTLEQRWSSLYHEVYDKIFQHDCDNSSQCEVDFNTRVYDLLENNPHGFGCFLYRLSTYMEENPDIASNSLTDFINNL